MDGPAPSESVAREPAPESAGAVAADRERLATWLESVADGVHTLLGSQRWRVGNLLGQAWCRLRGLGNPPTVADELCDTIARFRRWQKASVHWQLPSGPSNSDPSPRQPTVDVIICVHNALPHVQACLTSVEEHTSAPYRFILVEDGSNTETAAWLAAFAAARPSVRLLRTEQAMGYTRAVNRGLAVSTAEYVVLLNSDTVVTPHWLDHLRTCAGSHERIGLVGPLSNAASWQSVPERFDEAGQWAVNSLPAGISPPHIAAHLARNAPRFPRVPLLNGFCLLVKRGVFDAIGPFDEQAFPLGYGEETDFCLRAADAGFELALADQAYVYHAKSQSYGHDRRRELVAKSNRTLKQRYGALRLKACEEWLKYDPALAEARRSVAACLKHSAQVATVHERPSHLAPQTPRVLFVLPARPGGGGVHSVVQEALGMHRLGVTATVAIPRAYAGQYAEWYPQAAAHGVFASFRQPNDLVDLAATCDVAVGTIHHSLALVARCVAAHAHVAPAYYVQDYEPWFFTRYSSAWRAARRSYRQIPGCTLFAKTEWLCNLVREKHRVPVERVSPSLDHELFFPTFSLNATGPVRVCAMVRPNTPRRGALRTVRTLARLQADEPGVEIHVFGCRDEELSELLHGGTLPCTQHGLLRREEVAALLRSCHVFLDLSDYQAFGRTALEAMASGCATVVPTRGGAGEFARHGENALVVNTGRGQDLSEVDYRLVRNLVVNPNLQARLRAAGLATAAQYSVHRAVVSQLQVLTEAIRQWRCGERSNVSPFVAESAATFP